MIDSASFVTTTRSLHLSVRVDHPIIYDVR